MGLLDSFFGGYKSPIGAGERSLLSSEKKLSAEEQAKADALKLQQAEERKKLKLRSTEMRGGGRSGLMFRGSQQGVV